MAYSDYGGRVRRDGGLVPERCDAVLTGDGIRSTPGAWPGWTLPEARGGTAYHALLGDGPIYVGLYKQSYVSLLRLGEVLDPVEYVDDPPPDGVRVDPGGSRAIGVAAYLRLGRNAVFLVEGHRIEVRWTEEDNFYVYVRLIQPDGHVWTGWSGYGVGAGLEGSTEHGGYDSDARDARLREIFP